MIIYQAYIFIAGQDNDPAMCFARTLDALNSQINEIKNSSFYSGKTLEIYTQEIAVNAYNN
jgi:hypothetical protein